MKLAPISKKHSRDQDFNTNGLTKYRPRIKDLRQSIFCYAAKLWGACFLSDGPALRRLPGGLCDRSRVAMAALQ
jgi:hypothetical protein